MVRFSTRRKKTTNATINLNLGGMQRMLAVHPNNKATVMGWQSKQQNAINPPSTAQQQQTIMISKSRAHKQSQFQSTHAEESRVSTT